MKNDKPIRSVLKPDSGKLDEKACPVLHLNRPLFNRPEIKPVDVVLKRGQGFSIAEQRLNELCVSEGTYDLVFRGAIYSSILQRESEGRSNTFAIDGLLVGPLYLRVQARNGQHYYFFAPAEFVIPKTGKLPVPETPVERAIWDLAGAVRKQGIYGVVRVCGLSSDRSLTEAEETLARKSTRAICDTLDPERIKPGVQRQGPGPLIQ